MIQEILGCCWIKRQLIQCSEEEILNALDTKYEFLSWLTCLENVVSKEKFLASDPKIFEKARNVLRSKKFDYSNSPEIFSLCNSLQGYFNEYDALPQTIKYRLQREWVSEQIRKRDLPQWFQSSKVILALNASDYYNVIILLDVVKVDPRHFKPFDILLTTAWLMNEHPEIFKEQETKEIFIEDNFYKVQSGEHVLAVAKRFLEVLENPKTGMERRLQKKAKALQKKLEKLENSEETVYPQVETSSPKRKRKG